MKDINEKFTRPELAERLGINCEGRELNKFFTHLRSAHGLTPHVRDEVVVHYLGETRRALRAHWDDCGADEILMDVSELTPEWIPGPKQKIAAAIEEGLIREKAVAELAQEAMEGFPGMSTAVARVTALRDLNLQPRLTVEDTHPVRLYDLSEVMATIELWKALNEGWDSPPEEEAPPSRRKSKRKNLEEKLRELGGVTSSEVCARYGLDLRGVGIAGAFMSKLRQQGLEPIARHGNAHIYNPKQVEKMVKLEAVEPWPDRIKLDEVA